MQKMTKNKNIKHYLTYSFTTFVYGMTLNCLGPVIPYLSDQYQKKETQFSYLLAAKAYGMLFGALIIHFLQKKKYSLSCHQFMILVGSGISASSICFCYSPNQVFLGLCMFLGAIFYLFLQVEINICVIKLSQKDRETQFWLLIVWGFYSIGGIMGPIFVYLYGKYVFLVISILTGITIPFYLKLKSPQLMTNTQNFNQQLQKGNQNTITKLKSINKKILYLHCFLMFLYLGSINNISTWIPSYAVLAEASTKEGAVVYSSILFSLIALMRFIFAKVPLAASLKLKYSNIGILFIIAVTLALIKTNYAQFGLYIHSIFYGIFIAPVYAMIFSLSNQYGFYLQSHETSMITCWGVIGEGFISPVTGQLMQSLGINMLFLSVAIISAFMLLAQYLVTNEYSRLQNQPYSQSNQKNIELLTLEHNTGIS